MHRKREAGMGLGRMAGMKEYHKRHGHLLNGEMLTECGKVYRYRQVCLSKKRQAGATE